MLITLDLRQIRYFIALVEEGSITRAAERLHVVQPAVSMQIRKLEAEYGLTLFDRTSQGVIANDIARNFYQFCLRVIDNVEEAHHFLISANGRVMGDVVVAIPPTLSLGLMARIVRRYSSKFPEVKLRICEGYSSSIIDWLDSGMIDIGVLTTERSDPKFFSRPLIDEEVVAVVAKDNPKVQGATITGEEFAKLDVILPSEPNLLRSMIDSSFANAGIELKPQLEIDSMATVLDLVRSGYATLIPGHAMFDLLERFDLRALSMKEPQIKRTLIVSYNSQKLLSKAAEAFIEMLYEELQNPADRQQAAIEDNSA